MVPALINVQIIFSYLWLLYGYAIWKPYITGTKIETYTKILISGLLFKIFLNSSVKS